MSPYKLSAWVFAVGLGLLASASAHARDIVVAQVAPFGGPLAVSGRDFNLGALIAFDEANSSGGIRGTPIRLVSRDDGYRPADTLLHVSELLEKQNPVALIGMWGAENVEAVLAKGLLDGSGIAVVGVRSGVAGLRKNSALFHVRASYRDEAQRILDQAQTMGFTRVAMVYEDDGFGREAAADVQAIMASRKLSPAALVRQGKNQLDVAASVKALVDSQPQAIVLSANTPVAAALIKALRAANTTAFILTTSTVDAEQLATQLGPIAAGVAVAQGVPNPYKATAPIAREFNQRIRTLGIDPARANFASLEGYIVARVLIEGLKRSGAKEPTRRDLVRGLEAINPFDLGGFALDFSGGKREGSRFVDLSLIGADGRIRQ
jgi:branched-chain amino acid transport system substrate-binding protein